MSPPFFTIGHSTRTLPEFIELLKASDVRLLVDVRSIPRSRTNPQFNEDTLPEALVAAGIDYRHLIELGGRRSRMRDVAPSQNGYWTHQAFHNYADYATTQPFLHGLSVLRELGHRQRCAIMCSEAVWWRCHRRIIADYLLARGEKVWHILGAGHVTEATMTPGARAQPDETLAYPAEAAAG
ncbi:DUF488 domain-containing protein [Trinickia caryophylli]|uniref:DUF488 domain-containing protein n=1 Tax=Trinickia caryophylli TaxID=28094 RepID=A0A1X7GAC2_TRICW|nr:DUF488 domain-containing protein [Trinickia caryophylli]PMS11344.1 DUF488 domain-containing protein [Trinickia caryophylli]TRX17536.1 DUF488 domain-containing protein [Trinickia caryophylli]WQE11715.1 DUF488 domain-containing protein [Trinickia caryophylli]SMF66756.1 Protein of unknown function, DUF488 [Trinickia caryophylli]GLU34901.1 hypothetical protein Busp01_47430 [Trinickia caryophylli]